MFEGHRPVLLEGGQPGVRRGRHNRSQNAGGYLAAGVLVEVVDVCRAGPPPKPADGHDVVGRRVVDRDGSNPAEVRGVGQRDVDGDTGCHARIDCIAAVLQDPVPGRRRQVVAGRHHVRRTQDQRPV